MSIQAFIFDLDDTLIDTYGQLVARAHQEACVAMQAQGLNVPISELLQSRLNLAKEQPRQDVNVLLAQKFGCDDPTVAEAGFFAYFNTEIKQLRLFPGAWELLESLYRYYKLFLVTSGFYQTQKKKVDVLGIQRFFTEIKYISLDQPTGKQDAFEVIQNVYCLQPRQIVAVGDRVHGEIAAANQLGFHSVWIQQGEFAHVEPESDQEMPDFFIQDICELKQVVKHIENTYASA